MNVSPGGGGIVKIDKSTPSSYPFTYDFDSGKSVTVEAVPAVGYVFNNWSGDLSGTTNPTTIVMECNKRVTASFSRMMVLAIEVSGGGSTTPSAGIHNYSKGTVISVTAVPGNGWQFDGWSGDVADAVSATTTLIMDSDKLITARFSVKWASIGWIVACFVLAGLLVAVLIIRRRE